MDKVNRYFDSEYTLLNAFFIFVFSMPVSIGGLLFMIVQGDIVSENAVIIFILILVFYDLLYLIIYNLRKIPDFMLKFFFISDKNKNNRPENIYFDEQYRYSLNDKRYKLSEVDIMQIKILAKKIVHKKFVTRFAVVLTILTLVIPVFF